MVSWDFMVLELVGDEEVARCRHDKLEMSIWDPFQRLRDTPQGRITEDLPGLARQARILWWQHSLPAASFEEDVSSPDDSVDTPTESEWSVSDEPLDEETEPEVRTRTSSSIRRPVQLFRT